MKKNDTKNTQVVNANVKFVEISNCSQEALLVTEIHHYNDMAKQTVFFTAMEIGKRLIEAKKIIKHGQWTDWLQERVQFSQRTAQNCMNLYSQYSGTAVSNSQALADLDYTKALELLAVPAEEREEFIENNNIKDMSSRKLKETIAEMKKENENLSEQLKKHQEEKASLHKEVTARQKLIDGLNDSIGKLEDDKKLAEKNQDMELKKQLTTAIAKEKKTILTLESEKEKLSKQLDAIEKKHNEELEKVKTEEAELSKKLISQKEKEFEAAKKKLDEQLEQAQEYAAIAQKEAIDTKKQADAERAFLKCKVLMDSIQSDYKEILSTINQLDSNHQVQADSLLKTFNESLEVLISRSKVKIA